MYKRQGDNQFRSLVFCRRIPTSYPIETSYLSSFPNAFIITLTIPHTSPPATQASQNHMAVVPSGWKFEGSGDERIGINNRPSPTIVKKSIITPHNAPTFVFLRLRFSRVLLISSSTCAVKMSSTSNSSATFLLYSATLVRPSSMP